MEITDRQKELLNVAQWSFPLVAQPYLALAEKFNISEETVIEEFRTMKELGILRQMSAIFNAHALGYNSTLVVAKVADEHIEQASNIINAHPGVSFSCKRNNDYNLWYNIAVPIHQSLEAHVDLLHEISGALVTHKFPVLVDYKIDVKDDTGNPEFSEQDLAIIREAQEDLPLVLRPFAAIAVEAQCSEDDVINSLERFKEKKYMQRFAAVINDLHTDNKANAMAVWAVPEKDCKEIGPKMAGFSAVSQCFKRPTFDDWPYSIFTMIRGHDASECEEAVAAIAGEVGINEYNLLWAIEEYKKVRVRYFTPEWDAYMVKYKKELASFA